MLECDYLFHSASTNKTEKEEVGVERWREEGGEKFGRSQGSGLKLSLRLLQAPFFGHRAEKVQ